MHTPEYDSKGITRKRQIWEGIPGKWQNNKTWKMTEKAHLENDQIENVQPENVRNIKPRKWQNKHNQKLAEWKIHHIENEGWRKIHNMENERMVNAWHEKIEISGCKFSILLFLR